MESINHLRSRLRMRSPTSSDNPDIQLLAPDDVRNLRLPWLSHFNSATLARHLANHPNMALWVPQTGEYIVAEPWRNREEIANISEVTARRDKVNLVSTLLDMLRSSGYRLVLLDGEAWRDQSKLYLDLGFGKIESIVFFEKSLKTDAGNRVRAEGIGVVGRMRKEEVGAHGYAPLPTSSSLNLLPALQFSLVKLSDLDLLLEIDHDSFPWLWWNSYTEFEFYLQMPGVYAYIAHYDGEPVGYASFTIYQGWGHLDRLAVVTKHQGRKFGAAQLTFALQLMVERGASSVALSTQTTNVQSHRLYRGFGFHQTSATTSFFGIELKAQSPKSKVED